MKLLTFQAARFAWRPHRRTLPGPGDLPDAGSVEDAVVVFLHAEAKDFEPEGRARAIRHAAKHVQWLANKRGLRNVVLHSFTHLGAEPGRDGGAAEAESLLADLRARLEAKGYAVGATPYGFTCAWTLEVYGESLAKVWKEI